MIVTADRVPQGFEGRVDNLAAAVIVHVGNYWLIQPGRVRSAENELLAAM